MKTYKNVEYINFHHRNSSVVKIFYSGGIHKTFQKSNNPIYLYPLLFEYPNKKNILSIVFHI